MIKIAWKHMAALLLGTEARSRLLGVFRSTYWLGGKL